MPENLVAVQPHAAESGGSPAVDSIRECHCPDTPDADISDGLPMRLWEAERLHVLEVLRHVNGNKVQAAKALGVSRRALYRLIAKHHLEDFSPEKTVEVP